MNKGNKILLGILAFVVVCVVGYALFGETITVTGSATASGEWSISTTCVSGLSQDIKNFMGEEADFVEQLHAGSYKDSSCNVSGNTATPKVTLLYPSASHYFTVTITNTGQVDAVLPTNDSIDYAPTQTIKVYKLSDDSLAKTIKSTDANFDDSKGNYAHFISYGDGTFTAPVDAAGNLYFETSDIIQSGMMVKDKNGNSYLRLKPGEKLVVGILTEWGSRATDKTEYSVLEGTYKFDFQQITTDMYETTDAEYSL